MCETGQSLVFSHELRQKTAGDPGSTLNINSVVADQSYIPSDGAKKQISINGDVGTQFKLTVTSSDSSKTYDFSTNTFTASATNTGYVTIGDKGFVEYDISYPLILSLIHI